MTPRPRLFARRLLTTSLPLGLGGFLHPLSVALSSLCVLCGDEEALVVLRLAGFLFTSTFFDLSSHHLWRFALLCSHCHEDIRTASTHAPARSTVDKHCPASLCGDSDSAGG